MVAWLALIPGQSGGRSLSHRPMFASLLGLLFCGSCVDDSGLLVHCISGWDRTPLFISLLRLSLWAVSMDGLGHGVREHSEAPTKMDPLGVLGQSPKKYRFGMRDPPHWSRVLCLPCSWGCWVAWLSLGLWLWSSSWNEAGATF